VCYRFISQHEGVVFKRTVPRMSAAIREVHGYCATELHYFIEHAAYECAAAHGRIENPGGFQRPVCFQEQSAVDFRAVILPFSAVLLSVLYICGHAAYEPKSMPERKARGI